MHRCLLISLALSLPAPARVPADEPTAGPERGQWHHWRGPLATGVAPLATPPVKWDAQTNIRWKAPLVGRGSATPIVWGETVFVATAIKTDRQVEPSQLPPLNNKFEKKTERPTHYYQFVVIAFDRATGKERWRRTAAEAVPHEGHHPSHSYAAGSPTTDGKTLFVSFGSQGVFAYDFEGNLKWKRELGVLNTRLGWGEAVTPVLHGDSLLLNWDQEADSRLICLDAATGKVRWEQARDEKTSWNTPLVLTHQGQAQVIVNGTNRVRSYALKDGAPIWQCAGMTVNAIPSPVSDAEAVYVMSGYRGAAAVAVPLGSRGEVAESQLRWKAAKGTPYVPSPLLHEGRLYFTQANTPMLTILDAKTGTARLDRERLPTVKSFYASPVAAAGKVYLVGQEGTTLVLKAGDTLEVLATNRLDDPIDASPALVGKQLFLRGEKYLYCIEEK